MELVTLLLLLYYIIVICQAERLAAINGLLAPRFSDFSNTMPTTIKAVSPFYNDKGNSPPPFSPRLTDQLELFRKCSGQFTSVAKEVEDGSPLDYDPKPLKRCLKAPTSSSSDKSASASSPYPKKTTSQSVRLRSHSLAVSTSEESSESSNNDDCSSTLSEGSKIPKLPGEPGRPGRGGYTLETALDWNRKMFTKFKVS